MTRRVVLVVGPPCAGKTTWVRSKAQPNDLIVDHDDIAQRLGSTRHWRHTRVIADQAEQIIHARILHIARTDHITAWVIRCAPEHTKREALKRLLRAEVQLIDPGLGECLRRATADGRPPGTTRSIRQWYERAQ